MPKKMLLVDDDEVFLESLKEGLNEISETIETDISFSVNQAIKKILTNKYDLVVTDIRMPEKSGIELLIFLRDLRFTGKIMVMTAYSMDDSHRKIQSLGVVDVISKPFQLEWFKDLLLKRLKEKKEIAVTFESIDLLTVMQIINMEKKTSALQVDNDDKRGIIYFMDGEIIHAEYDGFEGERAVLKLISLKQGIISVKKTKDAVKRSIEIPFVEYILNIMKTIDELQRDQQNENKNSNYNKIKEEPMTVEEILKSLKEVNGYLGAGVFTPQGEILEGSSDISGVHFEEVGSIIHDTLSNSKSMTKEVGFGRLDMLQLYSEMGVIFAKCYADANIHFHTILVIKTEGNVAMARIKLNKAVDALKEIL